MNTNNMDKPSNLKARSIPNKGTQEKLSRKIAPANTFGAKVIVNIKAMTGINNDKVVD
ncbi:hypothetical protein NBRC116592_26650 [Colwellia sp. KU-HH00111]